LAAGTAATVRDSATCDADSQHSIMTATSRLSVSCPFQGLSRSSSRACSIVSNHSQFDSTEMREDDADIDTPAAPAGSRGYATTASLCPASATACNNRCLSLIGSGAQSPPPVSCWQRLRHYSCYPLPLLAAAATVLPRAFCRK
jgi:hypothetical protein